MHINLYKMDPRILAKEYEEMANWKIQEFFSEIAGYLGWFNIQRLTAKIEIQYAQSYQWNPQVPRS